MIRIILLSLVFSLSFLMAISQANDFFEAAGDTVFYFHEELPRYPGGGEAIYKLLSDSIVYPVSAEKDRIRGRVLVSFVVDTVGNVIDVHAIEGVRKDVDDEAIRVVSMLSGWSPGIQKGKKVQVRFQLPITFNPPKKRESRKYRKRKRLVD